jgi:hypothetical protein
MQFPLQLMLRTKAHIDASRTVSMALASLGLVIMSSKGSTQQLFRFTQLGGLTFLWSFLQLHSVGQQAM